MAAPLTSPNPADLVEQRRKILLAIGDKVAPGLLLFCITRMRGDEKAGKDLSQRTLALFASGARTFPVKPGEPVPAVRLLRFLFGVAKSLDDRRAPEHHLFVPLEIERSPESGPIERPEVATHEHGEKLLETAELRREALALLRDEIDGDGECNALLDLQLEGDLSVEEKVARLGLPSEKAYFTINRRLDRALDRVAEKMKKRTKP